MPEGTIMKALSGFYYVSDGEALVQCRARGVFRKRKVTPLVGDHVEYEAERKTEGYILNIARRKNELDRPPIANVDQAILVFSITEPAFDDLLLDRFLVHMEAKHIPSTICMTKWDLLHEEEAEQWVAKLGVYKRAGYPLYFTSSLLGKGIDELRRSLSGEVSVITGQSGVGKSSLLNAIDHHFHIDTQAISQSLGRGKHTTRHVELLPVAGNGFIADTPGFSSLDFSHLSLQQLEQCFPEFAGYRGFCRFRGCMHIAEPDCAVKHAVEEGEMDRRRYDHYHLFYNEITRQKKQY
ncbi:ribosome small subunit-dependent GTPase A [Sporolactobacillus sp. Y61]|jgi:ribosome biogenesis GTPase|uniref:Small ribosomal subunit biogenesis GTPase RsgA n=1 Tax=Sporolactobacillus sp. Y61 TaxID=3160863 RepID=A0AAU8ICU6_9BACL|nr:ribosome small subunit-dependent GTPase A [Sporolactobacillus sp. THM19-2]RYL92913.1 ribosome small subunit-dependent GTPase A [Sporolactobacillus sp. THM19-2]